MPTKAERNLEKELGPSPHPYFADKDEPWKDYDTLLRLEERHSYQYEIAHVLGCDPSKVSYWLEKAHDEWSPTLSGDDHECVYFEVCGYSVPHPDMACETCTDLARHNESADGDNTQEGETEIERIAALYDHYEEFERNSP